MRKVWLGIVGAVVCLGLGLAVVGWHSWTANKDTMSGDNMSASNMSGNNMSGEGKDKK